MKFNQAVLFALTVNGVYADFEPIAGYRPLSQVTDHNAIDLDQADMEEQLALGTPESQAAARAMFEEGGNSKSFAKVTLTSALSSGLDKGTELIGRDSSGAQVAGKALSDFAAGATEIDFQYKTSDIQATYVECQVGAKVEPNFKTCLADNDTGTVTVTESNTDLDYTYSMATGNLNGRTIQGFSTGAQAKMYDCEKCPYVDYEKFFNYYGVHDYANMWVTAAFERTETSFTNGNADFSVYGTAGLTEAVKKGTAYMAVWMYVIREFEDALDDCQAGCNTCNDDPVHAWDEGVAFYTGSLQGPEGEGSGKLIYALANKRCANFRTCGENGDELEGNSKVNIDLFKLFSQGQGQVLKGSCDEARTTKEAIVPLMTVPLIQGSLRYAYITDKQNNDEKSSAEGAVFAASVLPMVNDCDEAAAKTIYDNMKVGSPPAAFSEVKAAFESVYECIGITCADVGGLVDSSTGEYFEGAEPCGSGSPPTSGPPTSAAPTSIISAAIALFVGIIAFVSL